MLYAFGGRSITNEWHRIYPELRFKGHTKQLCINITTASTRLDTAQSGEPARLDGTITQDAFNVISFINYGNSIHTIRIVRIGYNFDNYMRPIDMIAIDYKNVKLLDKSLKL